MKKEEKEKRKLLLQELRQKEAAGFERSLPMGRALFLALFNELDMALSDHQCDDQLTLTFCFLDKNAVQNIEAVKEWIVQHGAHCDC